jgi:hypothetical protein
MQTVNYSTVAAFDPNNQPQPTATRYDWKTVNRKRSGCPDDSTQTKKQTKTKDYWLASATETTNRFSALTTTEMETEIDKDTKPEQTKDPKPPPIYVVGVQNINPLKSLLDEIAKDEYVLKSLGNDEVKVQPKTGKNYSVITKALAQKNTQFHTYKPKLQRTFRVVIKNLHYSTDPEEIKQHIELLGHEVENIWNIRSNRTKQPLSMFFIDLKQKENNKEIYLTKLFMNTSVIIEPPHTKREIPQCVRCQMFGHTKNYCQRNPRCVKCAAQHLTADCSRKVKDSDVKCVNCNENHPANYRGCIVHKQLQQKLYPQLRVTRDAQAHRMVQPGTTYAQKLMQNQQYPQPNQEPVNQPNIQSKIESQSSDDMTELKTMMKQLITQMGTMMNLLTTLVSKMA